MVQSMKNSSANKNSGYNFPFKWGTYTAHKLIGKGGMGEIFLAKDSICDRTVALKRIQKKMLANLTLRKRFINEARIAAQLSHPSIIPIYDLIEEQETIYYTMPYLSGYTLREVLKTMRISDNNLSTYQKGPSIHTLMLIFLNLCNAIEYTHRSGFLHRDIKPANIILDQYNNLTILDWGVATKIKDIKKIEQEEKELKNFEDSDLSLGGLTQPGKAVGTVEFLAPERVLGVSSSVLSDIYSLGCTLYTLLTLRNPFDRPRSIKKWRQIIEEKGPEKVIDPIAVAPHREITPQLSNIAMKCLTFDPAERYQNVREIIDDIQNYIQGKPKWIPKSEFRVGNRSDWKFQEHILLTKHMAISRYTGITNWATLMLTKESFLGNFRVETKVKLKQNSIGFGLLFCIPDTTEKKGPENGYLIWIGSKSLPGCKLLRSNVEIVSNEEAFLEKNKLYEISFELQNNTFNFFIGENKVLQYTSHIPISEGYLGLILRDNDLDLDPLTFFKGSQNVLINCLAIPNTLFTSKYYTQALQEYQRIAFSFKGRTEGRKALFQSGLTLIELAKNSKKNKKNYFLQALKEFSQLHNTPGAPVEYLGKSIVYQAQNNFTKEANILALGIKRYPSHPLKHMLEEHIIFRLHESAETNRIGAYRFILLSIQYLPKICEKSDTQSLINNLTHNWETAPFHNYPHGMSKSQPMWYSYLSQDLAFWLADPHIFYKIIKDLPSLNKEHLTLYENSCASLVALRQVNILKYLFKSIDRNRKDLNQLMQAMEIISSDSSIEKKLKSIIGKTKSNIIRSFVQSNLNSKNAEKLVPILSSVKDLEPEFIWALLLSQRNKEAKKILKKHRTYNYKSPYYILKGCLITALKGKEKAFDFSPNLIEIPFPETPTLLSYFLRGTLTKNSKWINQAFFWEKITLYRQLALYYRCLNKFSLTEKYEDFIEKEFEKIKKELDFIIL